MIDPIPLELIFSEITVKKQIVLHHTGCCAQAEAMRSAFYINKEGKVFQLFDEKYWAYHLGLTLENFQKLGVDYRYLEKTSIGITLENAGAVVRKNGDFYPKSVSENENILPVEDAYEYCVKAKWRNEQYWELYYDKQIESLRELLLKLCAKHNIPKDYNADIWDVSRRALMGTAGIFCHCSFRNDVSDPHPQIELINMLKTL